MKALVTGGGGFLGSAIVRLLRARGDDVVVVARGDYPELKSLGVALFRADITDLSALTEAATGCDVVFHTAAKAGVWGSYESYFKPNVVGTEMLIAACLATRVPKLVFTGSPSVVFDGRDQANGTSALPYAHPASSRYSATKAASERLVLKANSRLLATISLRPHLIYGPGDPHLVPRVIDRASKGRLALVGDGTNRVSLTYVDNAAAAHLQAADRLSFNAVCAGRAYFINDPEPVVFGEWLSTLVSRLGLPPIKRRLSIPTAVAIGGALEFVWSTFRLGGEPPLTRSVAKNLGISHWYSIDEAVRDFGYAPPVTSADGFEQTIEWFKPRIPRAS
ncbi:MAG TPA: NAD-dependent epimerase/dehydratase family protein [Vicinamibacteria bacterium]|nr:NAD-dependent epimerase/dehydratase family protein [Vicinamibacteria bacterium]HRB12596.1 NAD-dependent epimerase/dehydratase family protein [Vicinamibacteria bacterium]